MNHVCYAVLSECFSFVLCLSYVSLEMSCVRFYPNVLRSFCACHAFLSKCLAFDHACCLPHSAKQDGLRDVPFLFRRGSGSPVVRSRMSRGYRALLVHFGLVRFFMAIPTENERTRGTRRTEGRGERSRRRGVSALLREHIGFEVFSAGSPLGAARPQTCAKETRLPGLSSFDSRRGCVSRGEGEAGAAKT